MQFWGESKMPLDINGQGSISGITSLNTSASVTLSETELGYLDGVTSGLQSQINTKSNSPTSWISYTPQLTATTTNPTLGTGGIIEGQYIKIGNLVIGNYFIRFGTSGVNAGSGTYRVSLPSQISEIITGNQYVYGSGYVFDLSAGAGRILNNVYSNGNSFVTLGYMETTSNVFSNATNAAPWTWAASDEIQGNFMYMEAS
jgi:hypothetical protein